MSAQNAPQAAQSGFNVVTGVIALQNAAGQGLPVSASMIAALINDALQADHDLYMREYRRQYQKWCMINGTPSYVFNVPNLESETNAAIRKAATAVLSML